MKNDTPPVSKELNNVYDLVKYRLNKQIKGLPPDDIEVVLMQSIIKLYEAGIITVCWDDYDIWVKMADGSDMPPDLLDPFAKDEEDEEDDKDDKE